MPAVFQIVSRSSGKALARTTPPPQLADFPFTSNIVQSTQNDQDSTQMWVLTPQDSAEDFLIQPFGSPDLAIEVFASAQETEFPGSLLIVGPAQSGQVWRISRRIANPPYFFLLEASNDLLMDVPGSSTADQESIQIFTRTEHNNQQWTFLPIFAQLGNDG
jgi:hypothetical protein